MRQESNLNYHRRHGGVSQCVIGLILLNAARDRGMLCTVFVSNLEPFYTFHKATMNALCKNFRFLGTSFVPKSLNTAGHSSRVRITVNRHKA